MAARGTDRGRWLGPGGAALACAVLLAACGPEAEQGDRQVTEKAYASIDPPTPDGIARRVRSDADGTTLALPVGETFAVELVGVPTAGYLWAATEIPPGLEAAGTYGGPTSTAQFEPGFAGGSHWEVLAFRAVAAGEGVLKLEQRRAWESDEPPAKTFSLTVRVE